MPSILKHLLPNKLRMTMMNLTSFTNPTKKLSFGTKSSASLRVNVKTKSQKPSSFWIWGLSCKGLSSRSWRSEKGFYIVILGGRGWGKGWGIYRKWVRGRLLTKVMDLILLLMRTSSLKILRRRRWLKGTNVRLFLTRSFQCCVLMLVWMSY